jgi:hypothetical protein
VKSVGAFNPQSPFATHIGSTLLVGFRREFALDFTGFE